MSIGDRENPTYWLGLDAEEPDVEWAERIRQGLRENRRLCADDKNINGLQDDVSSAFPSVNNS